MKQRYYANRNWYNLVTAVTHRIHINPHLGHFCYYLEKTGNGMTNGYLSDQYKIQIYFESDLQKNTYKQFHNLCETFSTLKEGQIMHLALPIMDPLLIHSYEPEALVHKIKICKIFSSKARPLLISLSHINRTLFPDTLLILKRGEDLRKDMYTQVAFYIFNILWQNAPFLDEDRPYIYQYRVFPMLISDKDPDMLLSCIEFVPDSKSTEKFDWKSLYNKNSEQRRELHRSAAGGYVASWVLGIRDRHRDNMI